MALYFYQFEIYNQPHYGICLVWLFKCSKSISQSIIQIILTFWRNNMTIHILFPLSKQHNKRQWLIQVLRVKLNQIDLCFTPWRLIDVWYPRDILVKDFSVLIYKNSVWCAVNSRHPLARHDGSHFELVQKVTSSHSNLDQERFGRNWFVTTERYLSWFSGQFWCIAPLLGWVMGAWEYGQSLTELL